MNGNESPLVSIAKENIFSAQINNWKYLIDAAGRERAKILSQELTKQCKKEGAHTVMLISDPNGADMEFIFDFVRIYNDVVIYEWNSIVS